MSYIWYLLGYEDEAVPSNLTLRGRNELLKQIRESSLRLKRVKPIVKCGITLGKVKKVRFATHVASAPGFPPGPLHRKKKNKRRR